jgi:hypothetical protein
MKVTLEVEDVRALEKYGGEVNVRINGFVSSSPDGEGLFAIYKGNVIVTSTVCLGDQVQKYLHGKN